MTILELIFNDMLQRTAEGSLARKLLLAGAEGYNRRMAEINRAPQTAAFVPNRREDQ